MEIQYLASFPVENWLHYRPSVRSMTQPRNIHTAKISGYTVYEAYVILCIGRSKEILCYKYNVAHFLDIVEWKTVMYAHLRVLQPSCCSLIIYCISVRASLFSDPFSNSMTLWTTIWKISTIIYICSPNASDSGI